MNNIKKLAGFTLIELLTSITIIGILATTSVATFKGYFEKARIARAQHFANETDHKLKAMTAVNEFGLIVDETNFDELVDNRHIAMSSGILLENQSDITLSNDVPSGTGKSFQVIGGQGDDLSVSGDVYKINLENEISLSAWIKNGTFEFLGSQGGEEDPFLRIIITSYNGKAILRISTKSGSRYELSVDIDSSKWHHLMGSYDHSTKVAKLYVDGKLIKINKLPNINFFPTGRANVSLWMGGEAGTHIDNIYVYPYSIKGGEEDAENANEAQQQQ